MAGLWHKIGGSELTDGMSPASHPVLVKVKFWMEVGPEDDTPAVGQGVAVVGSKGTGSKKGKGMDVDIKSSCT